MEPSNSMLSGYFLEGFDITISKYVNDKGTLVDAPISDRVSHPYEEFELISGKVEGYQSLCQRLADSGNRFIARSDRRFVYNPNDQSVGFLFCYSSFVVFVNM